MGKKTLVNINGIWKQCNAIWVNANGNWKKVINKINVNGVWKDCISYWVEETVNVNFNSSTIVSRSQTINLPNLMEVKNVSADNGTVNYTVSGENVTVNVTGGTSTQVYNSTKYSENITTSQSSYSNNFPQSMSYSSGGYSGTLLKSGSVSGTTVQTGGSYTPADSKIVSNTYTVTGYTYCTFKNGSWVSNGNITTVGMDDKYYSSDGYSGTLKWQSAVGELSETNYPAPANPHEGDTYLESLLSRSGLFSGTVTRPASDTRTYATLYSQTYSGTTYSGGNDDMYAYKVKITYMKKQ